MAGSFCNKCDDEIIDSWGRVAKRDPSAGVRVMLDIGANVGAIATRWLDASPDVVVHSFELSPSTFAILEKRRASSPEAVRARWHLTNAGVADAPGVKPFFAGENRELSSLGPKEGALKAGGVVNITTISAIIDSLHVDAVDLVKIDVEGWEREAIAGMRLREGGAARVHAFMFETGEPWFDTRKGPSNLALVDLVDDLSDVPPYGYACFVVGLGDLLPISPPAIPLQSGDDHYGLNILCMRRDAPLHAGILAEHRTHLNHCLEGQGYWTTGKDWGGRQPGELSEHERRALLERASREEGVVPTAGAASAASATDAAMAL